MTDPWADPDPQRPWQPGTTPDWSAYYPPPGLYPAPWTPHREPLVKRFRKDGLTLGATTAWLVLLGAPLALLWRAVAPRIEILRTAAGPQPAQAESSQLFAPDGWFVVVSVVVGVVVGALAWTVLRRRGPAAPLGLAVGGLLAASVAAAVGGRLIVDQYVWDYCKGRCIVYNGTMHLNATAAIVALPVALLTAYAALTIAFDRD